MGYFIIVSDDVLLYTQGAKGVVGFDGNDGTPGDKGDKGQIGVVGAPGKEVSPNLWQNYI